MFYQLARFIVCSPRPLFKRITGRLVKHMYQTHPQLASRLTPLEGKSILISTIQPPARILILVKGGHLFLDMPRPAEPIRADVCLRAKLQDMLAIFYGEFDGDEFFFSKRFIFEGQTETMVHLRNAFDGINLQPKDILPPWLMKMLHQHRDGTGSPWQNIRKILKSKRGSFDPSARTTLQQLSVLEQKLMQLENRLAQMEQRDTSNKRLYS